MDASFPAFLVPLATLLVQRVILSVGKRISGTGVRRAGREYMNRKF